MRILTVHNHYGDYLTGGEGNVFEAESRLLEDHGHEVRRFQCTNYQIFKSNIFRQIRTFIDVSWSKHGYELISEQIKNFRPDIMHVHNYWLILTPSIFKAARDYNVPTVLTLHNYRLLCPGGQFLRNNKPCELCMNGKSWRVLWHRCYPGKSLLKSFLSLRLYRDTQKKNFLAPWLDAYICLTTFGRKKFAEGGLPKEKLYVKPNFMEDPLNGKTTSTAGYGAIFVGRISPEKGLLTLMKSWQGINYPLTIVGDGPQMSKVRQIAPSIVKFIGERPHDETLKLIRDSAFFVFPSEWYEGFPLSLLEAMALGRAAVASDFEPRREMIQSRKTGLLFQPGNPDDLRNKVQLLIADPKLCSNMGFTARQEYLQKYTPEKNYQMLMNIYERIQTKL
jgi:glycosyltransferase involved in cell wall biosynthesis